MAGFNNQRCLMPYIARFRRLKPFRPSSRSAPTDSGSEGPYSCNWAGNTLALDVLVELEVGSIRLDEHPPRAFVRQEVFRDVRALRDVDGRVADVQIGCTKGLQEDHRFVERLREADEHVLPADHGDRVVGVGRPADPLRLGVASPVLLDPFLERQVAPLAMVEAVLEAGRAERDRLAQERHVSEIGARFLQVGVSADAMSGDAREPRVETADALQIARREGRVRPRPVPGLDIAMTCAVRAPEDVAKRRTGGLVDVDEHQHASPAAHGQSNPR